jgi:hypothetical protein
VGYFEDSLDTIVRSAASCSPQDSVWVTQKKIGGVASSFSAGAADSRIEFLPITEPREFLFRCVCVCARARVY